MSKYEPLKNHLASRLWSEVAMTFAEVEAVLGAKLPRSAYEHAAWWANESEGSHVQAKAWLEAGFETADVDKASGKVTFKRFQVSQPLASGGGMEEDAKPYAADVEKKPRRHPAFGALKGTFTIEPGYDLTSPMYSDEEWAKIEKEMAEDWDQIEAGMARRQT